MEHQDSDKTAVTGLEDMFSNLVLCGLLSQQDLIEGGFSEVATALMVNRSLEIEPRKATGRVKMTRHRGDTDEVDSANVHPRLESQISPVKEGAAKNTNLRFDARDAAFVRMLTSDVDGCGVESDDEAMM